MRGGGSHPPETTTIERDGRLVVRHSPEIDMFLTAWFEHVAFYWREQWADREDHPYSRFATFLGERFLTDFDKRTE